MRDPRRVLTTAAPKPLAATLVALAVVLAACTGGSSPSPASQPSSPPATDDPASPSASVAGTPDPAAAREAACEAGAGEGTLVYWHNFAKPDEIFAAFNEAYPDIKVEGLANRPDDHVQTLMTEVSSGRPPTADILYGELNVLKPVFDADGVNEEIDWPALGVPGEILTHAGNVVRLQRIAGSIVYNTNEVSAADLPDTWEGLLDPKYDGQMIVDPRGRPFDQFSLIWGHDETIAYVEQLIDLNAQVVPGGTAGMLAVAGGQALMTTGGRSEAVVEQQQQGAPLDIKYLDVIAAYDSFQLVPKDAPHPNAAACMVAWLATDGRQVFEAAEFKSNETIPTGAPDDAKFPEVDDLDKADAVRDIGQEISELYTQGG